MYRMVVIDDEKWVIKSLVSTVQSQDWFQLAGEAHNGISGLKLIQELKPELAFVDIQMPGMGGLELIQKASELNLPTLFIVISGFAEFAYVQKAIFLGAISYCLKPFSKPELLACMEKAYGKISSLPPENPPKQEPVPEPPSYTTNQTVNTMLSFIHQNYHKDISVQDLAELCSINSGYVGQLFKRETRQTFSEYLTAYRLEKAANLLTETDFSISEIAAKVGYREYFYFAKVFKKTTGQTPSDFRSSKNPSE